MGYLGDDKARLRRPATKEAIELAMQSRWQEAIAVNQRIIESFPTDADAHNRLGRALTELGKFSEAKEAYRQALALNPHNSIARKNLARLSLLREDVEARNVEVRQVAPQLFIEERGKVGVAILENRAPTEVLARLVAGDQVDLRVDGQRLVVEDKQGAYLGQVGSRLDFRLINLIKGGNKYSAAITSLGQNGVKIVIKEVYQHPSQEGRLSFSVRETEPYRSYIREGLLKLEEEDLLTLDEEGEVAEPEESEAQAQDITLTEEEALEEEPPPMKAELTPKP